jgi:hypothetical protein
VSAKKLVFLIPLLALMTTGCGQTKTSVNSNQQTNNVVNTAANTSILGVRINPDLNENVQLNLIKQAALLNAKAVIITAGGGWANLEPDRNLNDINWATFDDQITAAKNLGMLVFVDMGPVPLWDAIDNNQSGPPLDCIKSSVCPIVSSYVGQLAKEMAKDGANYLIPSSDPGIFWQGFNPDKYAEYQNDVYEAVHKSASGIQVLSPEAAIYPQNLLRVISSAGYWTSQIAADQKYLNDLYSNKTFCNSLDSLIVPVGSFASSQAVSIIDLTDQKISDCLKHHVGAFASELSYPSSINEQKILSDYMPEAFSQGEAGQAQFLSATISAFGSDPNVLGEIWTDFSDPTLPNSPSVFTNQTSSGLLSVTINNQFILKQADETFSVLSKSAVPMANGAP